MQKTMKEILVIDDDKDILSSKLAEINKQIKEHQINCEAVDKNDEFKNYIEEFDKKHMEPFSAVEDAFTQYLFNNSQIKLVVVDRDLSELDSKIQSESSITKGAMMAGVPVCGYSRRTDSLANDYANLKRYIKYSKTNLIDVSNETVECAKKVVNIVDGFIRIDNAITDEDPDFLKQKRSFVVSKIIGKDYISHYLENYNIRPIMNDLAYNLEEPVDLKQRINVHLNGLWIYKYILPQPGILLNEKALASYINVDPIDFNKNKGNILDDFKYTGPFGLNEDYWWRHEIDDFLFKKKLMDGIELFALHGITVKNCKCSVNSEIDAGYYCVISNDPVSFEESQSGFSWIQPGADLARVKNDIVDELMPFVFE